jgi:hypothetical protein
MRNLGLASAGGEEPGDVSGQLGWALRSNVFGQRSVLGGKAGQPEGHIELRVADASEVPVDQQG